MISRAPATRSAPAQRAAADSGKLFLAADPLPIE
jgi:hypothetical protein